jgi:hypothetical protein
MALENGHYSPVTAKKVTHWPKPDKNGDGDPVWVEHTDGQGNSLGRDQMLDEQGNQVYEYQAPDGFRNVASKEAGSDGRTDNYVKVDGRGRVWRHPVTGHAAAIRPGTTLVEHPNGDFELLSDDFSRYLFEKSHEKVEAPADTAPVERPKTDKEKAAEAEAAELEEFRAWRASRQSDSTGKQD